MKSVLIDECPDISTDDVNQLSVSSGRADWGVVSRIRLQPANPEIQENDGIRVYTCLYDADAHFRVHWGVNFRPIDGALESYGDGGVRLYKDQMTINKPYTHLVGEEYLVFVRRNDNTVDVFAVPE